MLLADNRKVFCFTKEPYLQAHGECKPIILQGRLLIILAFLLNFSVNQEQP